MDVPTYEMIAYCGLDCSQCAAYLATRSDEGEALEKVAAEWRERFGMEVSADDVACDGCRSNTGRLSSYCPTCGVRECGIDRGVTTCAHCGDYDCERLRGCGGYRSQGKVTLDKIRAELQPRGPRNKHRPV